MGNSCTCISEIDGEKEEFKTKTNSERQSKKPTFKDDEGMKKISHDNPHASYSQNTRKDVAPVDSMMIEDVDNG